MGSLSACQSTPTPQPPSLQEGAGQTRRAIGDWNDIDAAVQAGASKSEMAIVSRNSPDQDRRIFQLRTITDEPVWLIVTRVQAPQQTQDQPLTLEMTCTVGRFGDPEWEERLLKNVARRLKDLAGVPYHPIR